MGKYVVAQAKSGVKFNLVAGNGEIIGTSEVYKSEEACLNGIESVKKSAPEAAVEDQTIEGYEAAKHPKFELYLDKAGEYRFRLKAVNGENILASEGYKAKAGAKNGIDSVKRNCGGEIVKKEVE